jgi:hypothetical protein
MIFERWAYQFALLGSGTRAAIGIALMLLGFSIGAFLARKSTRQLRRIPYAFAIAVATLAYSLTNFLWLMDVDAMQADKFWLLVAVALLILMAIAAAYGVAAVARSKSIDGGAGAAVFAVVPLLNLYLVFKAPQDAGTPRHPAARWLINIVSIVAIFLIFGLSKGLEHVYDEAAKRHESQYANDPALQAKAMQLITSGSDLAETLRVMAASGAEGLPIRLDEITQLTAIRVEGTTLIRTYSVADDRAQMTDRFRAVILRSLCGDASARQLLEAGATYEETYVRTNGEVIGIRHVRAADCQQ